MRLAFIPGRDVRPLTWLAIVGLLLVIVLAIQIRRFDDRVAYTSMFSGTGTPEACAVRSECERAVDMPCLDGLLRDGRLALDQYDPTRMCTVTSDAAECRIGFDGLGARCQDALRDIHQFRRGRNDPVAAASMFPVTLRIEGVVVAIALADQMIALTRRRRRDAAERQPN